MLSDLLFRLRALLQRKTVESELEQELRAISKIKLENTGPRASRLKRLPAARLNLGVSSRSRKNVATPAASASSKLFSPTSVTGFARCENQLASASSQSDPCLGIAPTPPSSASCKVSCSLHCPTPSRIVWSECGRTIPFSPRLGFLSQLPRLAAHRSIFPANGRVLGPRR